MGRMSKWRCVVSFGKGFHVGLERWLGLGFWGCFWDLRDKRVDCSFLLISYFISRLRLYKISSSSLEGSSDGTKFYSSCLTELIVDSAMSISVKISSLRMSNIILLVALYLVFVHYFLILQSPRSYLDFWIAGEAYWGKVGAGLTGYIFMYF